MVRTSAQVRYCRSMGLRGLTHLVLKVGGCQGSSGSKKTFEGQSRILASGVERIAWSWEGRVCPE